MKRGGDLAAVFALLVALTACGPAAGPAPSPPAIQAVGVATEVRIYQDYTRYVFADGSVHEVPNSYRQIGDGGGLVIIGFDSQGPFVASFPIQGGLPSDCYRENAVGIERDAYIEAEGILWAKAPGFASADAPALDTEYPAGTRFCFNDRGLIAYVIGRDETNPVPFDAWTFSADRRTVTVDFVGGPEFDPENPCSVAYHGTANIDGDELVIGIYAESNPNRPDDLMCTLEGHFRSLTISLPAPFEGSRVRDQAGQLWFLERPSSLVQITGLPDGWVLRSEESLPESPTGRWSRVYALPGVSVAPGTSVGQVVLFQAFGAPANVSGGDLQPDVEINGQRATFYFWEPAGEMVLVWKIGDDGVALVGNLADFTREEFIALAESVMSEE
ncbi:MAG: hypothetical protein ABIZ71_02425 [Gemmatimonadales bacterium]